MSRSEVGFFNITPEAIWTKWTIRNAVKEGYKSSGWVYRAVSMIAKNGASVPWVIENVETGELEPGHPVGLVLNRPNSHFSRRDFFELLLTWQQLAGNGFAKKVKVQDVTKELWPVSPDRLAPKPSKEAGELISGFQRLNENGEKVDTTDYTPDNTMHFKLLDPSDPLIGISPLQAVARTVDIDIDQQKWNKAAMQNRGVVDGIFTFDRDIDRTSFDLYKEMLKEMFGKPERAREPGLIGSNAKYQQLSLTPIEMDFLNSRKFNRDEIFIVFGVPPQLAGTQESSTYNNYSVSRRIFWEATVIPALGDLADTFNMSFYDELGQGKYIVKPDLTNVAALRDNEDEIAKTSKIYFDMGVPVSVVSERFGLNIQEYEGWDKSWGGAKPNLTLKGNEVKEEDRKKYSLRTLEQRDVQKEIQKKEDIARGVGSSSVFAALADQQAKVFEALKEGASVQTALLETNEAMRDMLQILYVASAGIFAGSVIVDSRGLKVDFEKRELDPLIEDNIVIMLAQEGIILTELSLIDAFTANSITDIILDGQREGKSIGDIQQAIKDSGVFSSERALRIARTATGTAQSIGQIVAARGAGALVKIWHDSGIEVRTEHKNRDGEEVNIEGKFSSQFPGFLSPRWPLDQNIAPDDRINCRCSMTFR